MKGSTPRGGGMSLESRKFDFLSNVVSFASAEGWAHNPSLWVQLVQLLYGILSHIPPALRFAARPPLKTSDE